MGNGVNLRKFRPWCLLLLLAVAMHAMLPVSKPQAQVSGSPFSPATIDVSTGHSRQDTPTIHAAVDIEPDGNGMQVPAITARTSPADVSFPVNAPAPAGWRGPNSRARAPPRA